MKKKKRRRAARLSILSVLTLMMVPLAILALLSFQEDVAYAEPEVLQPAEEEQRMIPDSNSYAEQIRQAAALIAERVARTALEAAMSEEAPAVEEAESTPIINPYNEQIPLSPEMQEELRARCEQYDVPLEIALGVIEAESSFNANAAGGKCCGYMAIHSCNAEWLKEEIGVYDLHDPAQNLQAGVYILRFMYDRQNDWHRALVCYNCGEYGAEMYVFSKGASTSGYSRAVMRYADKWAEVING